MRRKDRIPGGKRERTRAKLIAAAKAVVEKRGFLDASLDEIAARAGMTRGAIYSNFGGKADLMFELASLRDVPVVYQPDAPLDVQLRILAEAVLGLLSDLRGQQRLRAEFQVYAASEPALAKRIAVVMSRAIDGFEEQIERAYAKELRIPARALVVSAQSLAMGFLHQFTVTPKEVTEEVVVAAFKALAAGATKK